MSAPVGEDELYAGTSVYPADSGLPDMTHRSHAAVVCQSMLLLMM